MTTQQFNKVAQTALPREEFVLFGWLRTCDEQMREKIQQFAEKHHAMPCLWDYPQGRTLFLINARPDTFAASQALLIQIGYAHTERGQRLLASDWLQQKKVGPNSLKLEDVQGNPTLICLSQIEPAFWVYQSLPSISPIYYWQDADRCLFADTLRILLPFVESPQLNADAVPMHMIYRTMPGKSTYFKDIYRLLPGQYAQVKEGQLRATQLEQFDDYAAQVAPLTNPEETIARFNQTAEEVTASYLSMLPEGEPIHVMLLSGGVDSTLVACFLNGNQSHVPLHSISYAMRDMPRFNAEIQYAQHAVDLLKSEHTYFDIYPQDYVPLLEEFTDLAATPVQCEQDPCYLVFNKAQSAQPRYRYLFAGSGADTLLGSENSKRLLQAEFFKRFPGAKHWLQFSGQLVNGFLPNKAYGLKEIACLLNSLEDPYSLHYPLHKNGAMSDLDMVTHCFSKQTLRDLLEYRFNLLAQFTHTQSLVEQLHLASLINFVYAGENSSQEAFRAYGAETILPFMDSRFFRLSLSIPPQKRYYSSGRAKWIPKQMLEMRLPTQTTGWPKLYGGFDLELFQWMKDGVLRDLVQSITRPGFMSAAQFTQKLENPDWYTWNLLTFDLFQKRVLGHVPW